MKVFKSTLTFLIFTILIVSCSNDEKNTSPTVYPQENFWDGFISNGGYNNVTIQSTNIGHLIKFRPKVKGTINSFIVRQPQAGYISIWLKKNNPYVDIYSTSFTTTVSNQDFVKTITPIELQKDSLYYLIFSSESSFKYDKTNNISPIISGNIEIIGNDFGINADGGSGLSNFNNIFQPTFSNTMYGNVSFNFQRTK